MSEMLEKAARAAHVRLGMIERDVRAGQLTSDEERAIARAVIEAIRDPTAEVAEAGVTACWGGAALEVERDMFDWGWTAAIDAILGDGS